MSASFIKMCLAPPFTAKGWGVDEAGGMARSRGTGLKREGPWDGTRKGLAAALQRQLAPTGRAVRIRRRRPRGRIVGEWGCRETPPMCVSMLLTIKELAEQLRLKPSTLYAWASQSKIPCVRMHGLIRFRPEDIKGWLIGFAQHRPAGATLTRSLRRRNGLSIIPGTGKPDQH